MNRKFIAYYINKDDATERREAVERQLQAYGLKDCFVAIVPVDLEQAREASVPYAQILADNGMKEAEVSLFLTNEYILANHDRNYHAVIFEDDFVISQNGVNILEQLCEGDMDEDLCFLDCSLNFHNILDLKSYIAYCDDFHSNGNLVKLDPKTHYLAGANAILFNKNSIEKVANLLAKHRLAGLYDLFLRHFLQNGELSGSIVFPFLVTTSELGADSQLATVSSRPYDDILQKLRNCFYMENKNYLVEANSIYINDLRKYIFDLK